MHKYTFFLAFLLIATICKAQSAWQIHWVSSKDNPSYFEKNKSLPELLLQAVQAKKLTPYQLPQTNQPLQILDEPSFKRNMTIPIVKDKLITDETEATNDGTVMNWLAKDISLFTVYESLTPQGSQIDYVALYVPQNDKNIFIANFKFKDIKKVLKNNILALWQSTTATHFGEVLHLDINDGSAYRTAKILLTNALDNKIVAFSQNGEPINNRLKNNEIIEKIEDERLYFLWLVRPVEQKQDKNNFQPTALEIYYEDSLTFFVARFNYKDAQKLLLKDEKNYFLPYSEALKQKLFLSNLQSSMPTPQQNGKLRKEFKKQIISDLDLKEENNLVFFQAGTELFKILKESVENKQIRAFTSDSIHITLDKIEFSVRFIIPNIDTSDSIAINPNTWQIRQLYKMNLIEEMIFDQEGKQKSYIGKSIAIIIPAQENMFKGIDEPLVYFSFKEVIKILKKKKLKSMLNALNERNFKAIPLFTLPAVYK
jgi:hypothetical protein